MKKIVVFGGTGFIGKHLTAQLAKNPNYKVVVPVRRLDQAKHLTVMPTVQIIPYHLGTQANLPLIFQDAHTVINLIGILNESKKEKFDELHVEYVRRLLHFSNENKIKKFIHIGALGSKDSASNYLRSKHAGIDLVKAESKFMTAVINPSVVLGVDDHFTNQMAQLLRLTPKHLPLPGSYAQIQPITVDNLAEIIINVLKTPISQNKIIDIGGPEKMTLLQLVERIIANMGIKRSIIPFSKSVSAKFAALCSLIPFLTLYTRDNHRSLSDSLEFKNQAEHYLGRPPDNIDTVLYRRFQDNANATGQVGQFRSKTN